MPCIADHEFPHSPEKVGDLGVNDPADLSNNEAGFDVAFKRMEEAGPERAFADGEAFLDVVLDAPLLSPLSLPSPA